MKGFLVSLLILLGLEGVAQNVDFRGDSARFFKVGGSMEMVFRNKTKDTLGFLYNTGGGVTQFRRIKQINDTTFVAGGDTIKIASAASGGAGLYSLNGLTALNQTLSYGTAGTAPAWVSSGTNHALNIPNALTAGVTAGLVPYSRTQIWDAKIGPGDTAAMLGGYMKYGDTVSLSNRINQIKSSGITALIADVVTSAPDPFGVSIAQLSNTGVTPGTYTNSTVTVDSKGRILNISNGSGGGGSGTDNVNGGAGYRLVIGGQVIRTLFTDGTLTIDSTSNTNGLTFKIDSSKFATQYDLAQVAAGGGGITDLTGDIAATGPGSATATISNDVVSFAKFQNLTGQRLVGRYAGTSGDMQYITLGSGLTLNSTTGVLDVAGSSGSYTFSAPLSEAGGVVSIANAAADGTAKGASTYDPNHFNSSAGLISLDVTNGPTAGAGAKGFLTAADWTTFNNKGSGSVTAFTFTDGNGFDGTVSNSTTTPTLSLTFQNAAADGATKGQASFAANDFNAGAGNISIDWANTQKASSSQSGALSSTDWQTFNAKQNTLSLTTTGTGAATLVGDVLNIPIPASATVDAVPTDGSGNAVSSNGVFDALALKANIASPTLTGIPAAPTAAPGTNTTQLATTAFVQAAVSAAGGGSVTTFSFTDGGGFDGTVTNASTTPTLSLIQQNAAADGSTKGQSGFVAADFNAASGIISLDYTNAQKASSTLSGFLSATDWITFNNKQGAITLTTTGSGAATFIGGTLNIPIPSGTSYTFTASDFNESGSTVSLDYTNGQAASGSTKGYLTAADWNTFNNKQGTINLTTTGTSGAATFIGNTLNIPQYAGTTYTGATNRISIAGSVIDISSAYVGQNTITTLGTVGTGTWNGTPIGLAYIAQGGATTGQVLKWNGSVWAPATDATGGGSGVTDVTGTANRITSTGGTTPVIDIASNYVGQASITTLGTITAGTWNGTKIGMAYGGVPAGGNTGQILAKVDNSDNNLQWINNAGGITALTGDVTGSGSGSVATTLATVNSNVGSFTYGNFTVNAKGLITAASSGTIDATAIDGSTNPIQGNAVFDALALKQNLVTLTTTGSGPATFNPTTGALNIPVASGGSSDTLTVANSGATGERLLFARNDTLFGKRIIQGSNITITNNGDSSLTIASTGGGGDQTLDDVTTLGNTTANGIQVGSIITPGYTNNTSAKFGSIEFQSYAVNNNWYGDNIWFDGSNFKYRTNGFGFLDYNSNGGHIWQHFASGTGGANATPIQSIYANEFGNVSINSLYPANQATDIKSRKLYVNGSVGFNKDSIPTAGSPSGKMMLVQDQTTGRVEKYSIGGGGGSVGLDDVLTVGNSSDERFAITGYQTNLPHATFGTIGLQGYANTNNMLTSNLYYNTVAGSWQPLTTGAGAYIQMVNNSLAFAGTPSGTAATNVTPTIFMALSTSGVQINNGSGSFTLPLSRPASNGYVLKGNTDGTTSWAAESGGGGSQTLDQTLTLGNTSTNSIHLSGDNNTTNSRLKVGSFEVQPYALNNVMITDNVIYDGGFKLRSTGTGAVVQLVNGGMNFISVASGSAGAIPATTTPLIILANGTTTLQSLAGSGTRMVVADASGVLSTQAIPSGGSGMTNPMTTAGDLIVGGSSGTPARLGIGANGTYLRSNGSAASWSGFTADVRTQLSAGTGISYNSSTGVISATGGAGQDGTFTTLSQVTTNATTTNVSGSMTVSNGDAGNFEITVYAINSASNSSYHHKVIIPYLATSPTTISFGTEISLIAPEALGSALSSLDGVDSWDYGVDPTNGDLIIAVTGVAGQNIQWRIEIKKYTVVWSS